MSRRRRALLVDHMNEEENVRLLENDRRDEPRADIVVNHLSQRLVTDKYLRKQRVRNVLMLVNVLVVYTIYVVLNELESRNNLRDILCLVINGLSCLHVFEIIEYHVHRGRNRLKKLRTSKMMPRRMRAEVPQDDEASAQQKLSRGISIAFATWRASETWWLVFVEIAIVRIDSTFDLVSFWFLILLNSTNR